MVELHGPFWPGGVFGGPRRLCPTKIGRPQPYSAERDRLQRAEAQVARKVKVPDDQAFCPRSNRDLIELPLERPELISHRAFASQKEVSRHSQASHEGSLSQDRLPRLAQVEWHHSQVGTFEVKKLPTPKGACRRSLGAPPFLESQGVWVRRPTEQAPKPERKLSRVKQQKSLPRALIAVRNEGVASSPRDAANLLLREKIPGNLGEGDNGVLGGLPDSCQNLAPIEALRVGAFGSETKTDVPPKYGLSPRGPRQRKA